MAEENLKENLVEENLINNLKITGIMALTTAELATFCKNKGFIYPSSDIYGGISGLYDYGHLGTLLKKNLENVWRKFFLSLSSNYYEIEACQIMHNNVFSASGHSEHFVDPILSCSKCPFTDRADHFLAANTSEKHMEGLAPGQLGELIKKYQLKCPHCKSALNPIQLVNMMFPLRLGTGQNQVAYLRPETAQGPYVNFKLQHELLRKKLPLGLAVIGKAFRNEISPRNLTLRQREFTQAELQIFFNPANFPVEFKDVENYKLNVLLVKDRKSNKARSVAAKELKKQLPEWYIYHLVKVQQFFLEHLKIPYQRFRLFELNDKEKAFYNKYHFDIEVDLTTLGFTEIGGVHYRTDHDLSGHQKVSQQSLEVIDENNRKFLPHVLELSFGVDRMLYSLLDINYCDDRKRGNIVLKLPSSLAPFYCIVFPLVKNKPELVKKTREVCSQLRTCYSCGYDEMASIGRRYARADEIGIPYCITVDFESLEDNCVTVRNRDNTEQERVKLKDLSNHLFKLYYK